jgi:hypothetical protein
MFKAIQRADHASLRALAKMFIGAQNDPAALLCLDHVFSSPPSLRNLPFLEVQGLLSLYLEYVRLLNKFWHDESLAQGSNHQKLFGFQVLGDNLYLVPEHTILHEELTGGSVSGGESVDGHRCGYDELSLGIVQLIKSRISDRTEIQNKACCDIHGFSPCLSLLVEGKCNPPRGKGPCTFHHIQPEQLTVDWYHARVRLVLLQFQILDTALYHDSEVVKYVLAHPARNACGDSLNVKLLAWDILFSPSSTVPEVRIVCKS